MSTTAFSEMAWPEDDKIADALLAACLVDRDSAERAVELLTPEDMPDDAFRPYREIFAAIASLVKRGKKPAAPLVAEEMRRAGVDKGRYADALGQLARSHHGGVNVDDYCAILRRYSIRRGLRMAGHRMVDLSNDDGLETEEYLAQAESFLGALSQRSDGTDEPVLVGELIRRQLEEHKARKPGQFVGLKTGYPDLDALLRGMKPGDYIILAARPSVGKTTLAQNIADNVAKAGGKVGFVSAEMPDEQVANRIIASEGGVDGGRMMSGLVEPRHWESAEDRLRRSGLMEAKYWIDDRSQTVAQIRARAIRQMRLLGGLDLLLVDYLQQLKSSGAYRGQRVNEVAEISSDLKRLAKELGIPIIALSQLSRSVEKRGKDEDKRPGLADLRDSGSIEQDADVVGFLYRESYYVKESTDYTTEVIIAKNRNGPLGVAKLMFIPTRTRFESIDKRHG